MRIGAAVPGFLIFPLIVFGIFSVNSMIRTHLYSASRALRKFFDLLFQRLTRLISASRRNDRFNRLSPRSVRYADHAAFKHSGMFHQDIFRPHPVRPESRICFDDIIKAPVKPVPPFFILIGRVSGMIDAASPYMTILCFVIQISRKNPNRFCRFGGGTMAALHRFRPVLQDSPSRPADGYHKTATGFPSNLLLRPFP